MLSSLYRFGHSSVRHVPVSSALCKCFSAVTSEKEAVPPAVQSPFTYFRTQESDPVNHTSAHEAQFYTVPTNVKEQIFQQGAVPKSFDKQVKTFQEMCLMIRQPALEIIEYLRKTNFSAPVNRYVLYGQTGTGKSLTLSHLINYGHTAGFLIVHIPWIPLWMKFPKEIAPSTTRPGNFDHPLDAAAFLVNFKLHNGPLLKTLDLHTCREYVWSKRETTPKGSPIVELIDHGINRIKYASDCVVVLMDELKEHSSAGRCKTLVALDGFNAFFSPHTNQKRDDRTIIHPKFFTLTEAFLNITRFDWTNGAVIVTVDELAVTDKQRESYFPRYQLNKEGFEHLDPFIPVQVSNYSEKEFDSCFAYYIDRLWIQTEQGKTETGKQELAFLSARNPYKFMELCGAW